MRVLSRALRDQGDPIPLPWPELPIKPGPGDVVMGLAAPGVGKSFFSLNWAFDLAKRGRPVLMMSTDTDYSDQAVRLAALASGRPVWEVEQNREAWADWLYRIDDLPIRWSELFIDADDFSEFLRSEVEFLGEPPALVVVDVVGDMLNGREETVGNIRHIFTQLKKGARKFRTTVLALHHVRRGDAASGTSRVRLSDGLYGGEQITPIVLSMWRPGMGVLTVAVVKNRRGQANAEGLLTFDLKADYERALIASKQAVWS